MKRIRFLEIPEELPVSIEEAKLYLKVETNEDDSLIEQLIKTAKTIIENITGVLIGIHKVQEDIDIHSLREKIYVSWNPLVEVASVEWVKGDDSVVETQYIVKPGTYGTIELQRSAVPYGSKFLRIRYFAGVEISEVVKTVMLKYIAFHYELRISKDPESEIGQTDEALQILKSLKVWWV